MLRKVFYGQEICGLSDENSRNIMCIQPQFPLQTTLVYLSNQLLMLLARLCWG